MRAILAIALAACGSSTSPLPPNTVQACDRAIECGVFHGEHSAACVACLEHINPAVVPYPENLPPLGDAGCALAQMLTETNLPQCIHERWYGP